ncbi:GNAT family N-acetyltransferase [Streptosporangium sandarakinum]|uniref:GNAT family N-acetyltransferase n=1 Tax=Streptosporangium sandarakinum TaxID=1260955 RepID=UPI00342365BF
MIRPLGEADLPRVVHLCERELECDRDPGEIPRLLMRREVLGYAAVREESVVGFLLGSTRQRRPVDGSIDLLVVDRTARRRGIARALVAAAEHEFAALGCEHITVQGNPPYYVWPGIDISYTPAICFFEDLGYTRGRALVDMEVDLHAVPLDTEEEEERLRSRGIEIRRAVPEDRDVLHDWVATGAGWPAVWAAEVVIPMDEGRGSCHVALTDGKPIAFCAHGINQRHVVGPMATALEARGMGIGMLLMKRCLAEQRELGLRSSTLGWAGPLSLYSDKLDALITRCYWQYTKPLGEGNAHGDV